MKRKSKLLSEYEIFRKTGGYCGYCGTDITEQPWRINSGFAACMLCNLLKRGRTIKWFRTLIDQQLKQAVNHPVNRIALQFRVFIPPIEMTRFYFEKMGLTNER